MSKYRFIIQEQLDTLKPVCKKLYLESRKRNWSLEQQDKYFNDLIEELSKEALGKVLKDDAENVNEINGFKVEDYLPGFILELKELAEIWKNDFVKEIERSSFRKPFWKIWFRK